MRYIGVSATQLDVMLASSTRRGRKLCADDQDGESVNQGE